MYSTGFQTLTIKPHLKIYFSCYAVCVCKKTPQKLHTQLKNIFHKIPQANDVQHTLIFSSLLRSFFLNKKREMIVVIHYIDCNTNQREPSNTLKKPFYSGCYNSISEH